MKKIKLRLGPDTHYPGANRGRYEVEDLGGGELRVRAVPGETVMVVSDRAFDGLKTAEERYKKAAEMRLPEGYAGRSISVELLEDLGPDPVQDDGLVSDEVRMARLVERVIDGVVSKLLPLVAKGGGNAKGSSK